MISLLVLLFCGSISISVGLFSDISLPFSRNLSSSSSSEHIWSKGVTKLIVLPGGGPGRDGGYPEWTRQRVQAAYDYYQSLPAAEKLEAAFVTLSAGSLNGANQVMEDKRIIFECQFMMNHLIRLGVPKQRVWGDMFSWDTVTNGLSLRLFLQALLAFHSNQSSSKVHVEVFISDFHADRVEAAFNWVLNLSPPLRPGAPLDHATGRPRSIPMTMHRVPSSGSMPGYEQRLQHEAKGTKAIHQQAARITSFNGFLAFVLLGGHKGLRSYLLQEYTKSVGGGW